MLTRRSGGWVVVALLVIGVAPVAAADKKEKPARKSGTVTGVVTDKGPNFILVKADGEEKARRYTPRWVGGLPKDGGGFDKTILETFKKLKVGTRIRMEWEFNERPRAVKIEILKQAKKGKG